MKTTESMIDAAYEILDKKGVEITFNDLFNTVCELLEMNQEERENFISQFYTSLTLDGRFVTLGENVWDLRVRHTFDKVHIDMNDVYKEVEEESEEEDEEEKEFLKETEGVPEASSLEDGINEDEEGTKPAEVDYDAKKEDY